MLLQILKKIPDVTAQLLREDSDSSRTCLQMVVNMCYSMIIAFPRSDNMYDPVIRAMKVPCYRNFLLCFFSMCAWRMHVHVHTHTRTHIPVHMPACVSSAFICETTEPFCILGVKKSERQISFYQPFVSATVHEAQIELAWSKTDHCTKLDSFHKGLLITKTFITTISCCVKFLKR